jgi:UDP-N-acetylmuramoyl-L-alanyl-D-glutamate--2,6-diaminopimelate ligase
LRLSALSNIQAASPDPDIQGLTQDSRQVRRGYLFAAIAGSRADGTTYIADAVRNGAVAVLVPLNAPLPPEAANISIIQSDNPRHALSLMAAKFYAQQPDHIVAVTGTNGKTSTVHFTQQLWQARGLKSASLGTLGVRGVGLSRAGSMTTPDPVALHGELADLAAAGITHLAMEASSHGLQQCRLDGVLVSAAGFTNLTRDHLDYHATMDEYLAAKTRLFGSLLQPGGTAVLNADIVEFPVLKTLCENRGVRVWGYGHHGLDFKIISRTALPQGQNLELEVLGQRHKITLPLVGEFQAMNALCALGLAMAGNDDQALVAALEKLHGAPGRLQLVPGHPGEAAVYVDYAHTPDALANILAALRPHTQKRLICLFGCGGDRDPGKRPIMGKIAAHDADLAIITDDNPRNESPEKIRAAIADGAGPVAKIIDNRRTAIQWAVAQLQDGDVLVVAGKGHEQGQVFADRVDPFDDVDEVKQAIERLKGKTN